MRFLQDLFSIWNKLKTILKKTKSDPYLFERDWDFTELDLDDEFISAIKILTGTYKGVIYYYTTVKVVEDLENGARISFTYKVHENPTGLELSSTAEFKTVTIQILDYILRNQPSDVEAVTALDHFNSSEF